MMNEKDTKPADLKVVDPDNNVKGTVAPADVKDPVVSKDSAEVVSDAAPMKKPEVVSKERIDKMIRGNGTEDGPQDSPVDVLIGGTPEDNGPQGTSIDHLIHGYPDEQK